MDPQRRSGNLVCCGIIMGKFAIIENLTKSFQFAGDKDKNKVKHILLSADTEAAKEKEHFVQSIHVHIDNTRDIGVCISRLKALA